MENICNTSRFAKKKDLQKILSNCRKEGLKVEKLNAGYQVIDLDNKIILKAMNGSQGYLVRLCEERFHVESY